MIRLILTSVSEFIYNGGKFCIQNYSVTDYYYDQS